MVFRQRGREEPRKRYIDSVSWLGWRAARWSSDRGGEKSREREIETVYPDLGGKLPGRPSDRGGEKSREREIETVYPDLGGELPDGLQTEGERKAEKER
jgi:hypothetical protein